MNCVPRQYQYMVISANSAGKAGSAWVAIKTKQGPPEGIYPLVINVRLLALFKFACHLYYLCMCMVCMCVCVCVCVCQCLNMCVCL